MQKTLDIQKIDDILQCNKTLFFTSEGIQMQTKFMEVTNQTMFVNANLINKAIEFNVKMAQDAVKDATNRAGELLKVKTITDYAAFQGSVMQSTIEGTNAYAKTCADLAIEARDAYADLWQNYTAATKQAMEDAVKMPKLV